MAKLPYMAYGTPYMAVPMSLFGHCEAVTFPYMVTKGIEVVDWSGDDYFSMQFWFKLISQYQRHVYVLAFTT